MRITMSACASRGATGSPGGTTARGQLSRHARRHDDQADRDGPITDASVGTGWPVSPTVRIDALLGWTREQTEREPWCNARQWVQLGATAALPQGVTVGGSGTMHGSDHEGNWTSWVLGGGSRSDPNAEPPRFDVHNRALKGASHDIQLREAPGLADASRRLLCRPGIPGAGHWSRKLHKGGQVRGRSPTHRVAPRSPSNIRSTWHDCSGACGQSSPPEQITAATGGRDRTGTDQGAGPQYHGSSEEEMAIQAIRGT